MQNDTSSQAAGSADEREIRRLHRSMLDAWGAGDATAFAAPFSDDAVFVAFDGSVLVGRAQIAGEHQDLFDRWLRGTRLVEERTDVRFLGAGHAVVHSIGGTVMRRASKPAPQRDSIQTLIAVKDGGRWSFVAFQNTRIRPIAAGAASTFLWLVPDRLWGLLFRLTRTTPRKVAAARAAH